jgi:hypothetical protein
MFPRIPRLIFLFALCALSACAGDLRARYDFEPNQAHRVDAENGQAEMMIRCTEEDDPRKCQFEDESLILDLELVNRAPLVLLTNETDEVLTVLLSEARFIVRGGDAQKIERIDEHETPERIEIPARESVELRINMYEAWEERCEDISDYEGPTRPGEGSIFGANAPAAQKRGAPAVAGCFQYPKAFLPEDAMPKDRTKTVPPAEQRVALQANVGAIIQLVLPVMVGDERLEYVVAYEAVRAEIK